MVTSRGRNMLSNVYNELKTDEGMGERGGEENKGRKDKRDGRKEGHRE